MAITAILSGSRVRLTAMEEDDLEIVSDWFQDSEFMRMLDALPSFPKTVSKLQAWFEDFEKAPNAYLFAIRRLKDNALIGYIELEGILWTHQTGWFGIAIGEAAYRGQGYGTESAHLALDFAFNELNLHRVQATVFGYNEASNALFQKLGFQREGTFREFLHRDGQRHDMRLYGLLQREYTPLHPL